MNMNNYLFFKLFVAYARVKGYTQTPPKDLVYNHFKDIQMITDMYTRAMGIADIVIYSSSQIYNISRLIRDNGQLKPKQEYTCEIMLKAMFWEVYNNNDSCESRFDVSYKIYKTIESCEDLEFVDKRFLAKRLDDYKYMQILIMHSLNRTTGQYIDALNPSQEDDQSDYQLLICQGGVKKDQITRDSLLISSFESTINGLLDDYYQQQGIISKRHLKIYSLIPTDPRSKKNEVQAVTSNYQIYLLNPNLHSRTVDVFESARRTNTAKGIVMEVRIPIDNYCNDPANDYYNKMISAANTSGYNIKPYSDISDALFDFSLYFTDVVLPEWTVNTEIEVYAKGKMLYINHKKLLPMDNSLFYNIASINRLPIDNKKEYENESKRLIDSIDKLINLSISNYDLGSDTVNKLRQAVRDGDYSKADDLLSSDEWAIDLKNAELFICNNKKTIHSFIESRKYYVQLAMLNSTSDQDMINNIYKQACDLSVKHGENFDILYDYSEYLRDNQEYSLSVSYAERLFHLYCVYGCKKKDYIRVCILIGELYRRCNDYDMSEYYLKLAKNNGDTLETDPVLKMEYYITRAGLYFAQNDYVLLNNCLSELDDTYIQIVSNLPECREQMPRYYHLAAINMTHQEKYSDAVDLYEKVLRIYDEEIKEKNTDSFAYVTLIKRITESKNNEAFVYTLMGNYDEAKSLYDECLKVRLRYHSDEMYSNIFKRAYTTTLVNMAVFYKRKNEYIDAIKSISDAIEIRREILKDDAGYVERLISALVVRADVYVLNRDYDKARRDLVEIESYIQRQDSEQIIPLSGFAKYNSLIACCKAADGDKDSAEQSYNEALYYWEKCSEKDPVRSESMKKEYTQHYLDIVSDRH